MSEHRGARSCFCANMNSFRLILSILVTTLLVGGIASPQTASKSQKNYPAIIKVSAEHRARAERIWRRMLDVYNVPQTPPDLYPITDTPRTLLGVSGGIKIMAAAPEPGTESLALREAMKGFIERWRDLLNADPTAVSLVGANPSETSTRLTYRQANFAFSVAGTFGELVAVLSPDGRLLQLDDRFIPTVELPTRPQVEREGARKKVVGRTFTYTDIAGRPQQMSISSLAEVTVKEPVIFPIAKGDSIEVHLAWQLVAGTSLSWTIYIDAITGEELKVVQNFQT